MDERRTQEGRGGAVVDVNSELNSGRKGTGWMKCTCRAGMEGDVGGNNHTR